MFSMPLYIALTDGLHVTLGTISNSAGTQIFVSLVDGTNTTYHKYDK